MPVFRGAPEIVMLSPRELDNEPTFFCPVSPRLLSAEVSSSVPLSPQAIKASRWKYARLIPRQSAPNDDVNG
jgi:hypothetical protein